MEFLETVSRDMNHNEGLLRACMGIIAYEAFPPPSSKCYHADLITQRFE